MKSIALEFFKLEKHATRHRPDGFCLESLQASDFFTTTKRSNQERPLATKVFNRTKRLILGVKLDSLEARLRPVEHLDKDVEIGCGSSWKCD